MQVVDTLSDLRTARANLTGTVGLVPTMGALHAGHMALVRQARTDCDAVITTIFVNPTQFGPDEDLASYPRSLSDDLDQLRKAGVDLVFTPTHQVMYPPRFQTWVHVEDVSRGLEGAHRPGHFRGVATVVAKLFNQTTPHRAYFGQKDAQQVVVIRQMAHDLNFPVQIIPVPTVREPDGLARSSRNAYLSPTERQAATVLSRALRTAADRVRAGETNPDTLRHAMRTVLAKQPLAQVDYVSIADPLTLQELEKPFSPNTPILASLTVKIGKPRLLDNMLLPAHLNTLGGLTAHLGIS